ncbi:Rap-GAP domain-containing protein [Entamoeba marina]
MQFGTSIRQKVISTLQLIHTQVENLYLSFNSLSNENVHEKKTSIEILLRVAEVLAEYPSSKIPIPSSYSSDPLKCLQERLAHLFRVISEKLLLLIIFSESGPVADLYSLTNLGTSIKEKIKTLNVVSVIECKPMYEYDQAYTFKIIHRVLENCNQKQPIKLLSHASKENVLRKSVIQNSSLIQGNYEDDAFLNSSAFKIIERKGWKTEFGSKYTTTLERPLLIDTKHFSTPFTTHFLGRDHISFIGKSDEGNEIVVVNILAEANKHNTWKVLLWTKKGNTLHSIHGGKKVTEIIKSLKKSIPYVDKFNFVEVKDTQKLTKILKRDEVMNIKATFKFGVLYCTGDQGVNESEMYNNQYGSSDFEDFLMIIGKKIKLANWKKYAGGLDVSEKSSLESIYTDWGGVEIMFHVSTYLPHISVEGAQQTEKKRHIGNDIIVVVFMDKGEDAPFDVSTFKSQFNTVFVLVYPIRNSHGKIFGYSVVSVLRDDMKSFSPKVPRNNVFKDFEYFRDFLLTKLVQAELAALNTVSFESLAQRTRNQMLLDLGNTFK